MTRQSNLLMVPLVAASVLGCTWIRKHASEQPWLCEPPSDTNSEESLDPGSVEGAKAAKPKKTSYFFYIRAKRIQQAQPTSNATPVHHMCWYQAESEQDFTSETDFEQALQENPAGIKTKSLFGIFTPSSVLAEGVLAGLKKSPDLLSKSGLSLESIDLSKFDRLLIGNEASVSGVMPALASLVYFGGHFALPPDGDAGAISRTIGSKNAAPKNPESKKAPQGDGQPLETTGRTPPSGTPALPRLSQEFSDFIEKSMKEYGITNPPESLLRLPIESLAEYPCPEY